MAYQDDRMRALLEAMKMSGPGGPLMGGGGGMGRIMGRPGVSAGSIRGGIGNRGPGRGSLAFSPFAAQMAQGKANLHAPTQGAPTPGGNAYGFYGDRPPQAQNEQAPAPGPMSLGDPGPSAPAAPSSGGMFAESASAGLDPYSGEVADANTLMRLLRSLGGMY
jgi:hypothetical protein